MGLAAPRKKTKISHDPNNTNWSRSTSGFGHKILSSQGWTPGSFLGARNAAHADMFTAASASHIRVVVKDDTLGLGARPRRDRMDEPTGLDAFKGLLGRLNGKSDVELKADQKKRDDANMARYAANKWHAVRFVSGGLLSQEKNDGINESQSPVRETSRDSSQGNTSENDDLAGGDGNKRSKKKTSRDQESKDTSTKSEKRKDKKGKKRKHPESFDADHDTLSKGPSKSNTKTATEPRKDSISVNAKALSRERRPMGRNIFRGRHIEQKKKALLDDKSLNEIFMVKS